MMSHVSLEAQLSGSEHLGKAPSDKPPSQNPVSQVSQRSEGDLIADLVHDSGHASLFYEVVIMVP